MQQPRDTFWTSLEEPSRRALLRAGRPRRFRPGEHLCHQGDTPDHVLVISGGWAKVCLSGEDGAESVVAVRGPGDLVGEAGLITGTPRSATITALRPVSALAIPRVRFQAFLSGAPDAWPKVYGTLSRRLVQSDERFLTIGTQHRSGRLALFLLRLAADNGTPWPGGGVRIPPLSQSELGSCVDASRETVARALRDWRDLGLVETGWRHTVIRDPGAFRAHATARARGA
ncbi:Crp/Fnr family transcriptional regulator [Actinocorallia sp. API 0066]|uniref:Crp/Fnr family transcriptional regulator n=1 Tax=Actinocorallia sp. API 0066 TaxID=2896846 RepID=UPI001E589B69|nr:Crp/Fnr family transcriptional regulator [Actinocorallia sp. API 0066]MCD0450090.1 Crp/Fnr family transcriptional regulator [Actinocorallia sp. API 0066]